MSRRVGTLAVGALLLIGLGVAGATIPVPYVALVPGPTYNTLGRIDGQQIITVTGKDANTTTGNLNLTTVGVINQLELFSAVQGWFADSEAVVPRDEVVPPDVTPAQYDEQTRQQFIDSQSAAVAAALGELGYPLEVLVASVPDGSPSTDQLVAGDVLDSIDGTTIVDRDTLLGALNSSTPGSVVTVGYTRGTTPGTATVTTTAAADGTGAALGITISSQRVAPFQVEVSVPDIGGPSAGLMLTLGVLDTVGTTDLTAGKFIAGTGTITDDGQVGVIGGIRFKLIAAEAAGAEVFLVPAGNCAEAVANDPAGLPLASVATLDDALAALADVRAGRTPPAC